MANGFSVPTYGGFAIFGQAPTINYASAPRAEQRNTFFGLDGEECLDGGFRGGTTTASGTLIAGSPVDLQTLVSGFASLQDGNARILIDTNGSEWANVKLESFRTVGRTGSETRGGVTTVWKGYEATFHHLS